MRKSPTSEARGRLILRQELRQHCHWLLLTDNRNVDCRALLYDGQKVVDWQLQMLLAETCYTTDISSIYLIMIIAEQCPILSIVWGTIRKVCGRGLCNGHWLVDWRPRKLLVGGNIASSNNHAITIQILKIPEQKPAFTKSDLNFPIFKVMIWPQSILS